MCVRPAPEIRQPEADVGIDRAYQGHVRNIVPFGDHLGADQDVEVALAELVEDGFGKPMPDRVSRSMREMRARRGMLVGVVLPPSRCPCR